MSLRTIVQRVAVALGRVAEAMEPQPPAPAPEPSQTKPRDLGPEALERALRKHHKPGMTYEEITEIINGLGFRTTTGKPWQKANLRLVMEPLGLKGSRVHPKGVTRSRRKTIRRVSLQDLADSRRLVSQRTRRIRIHPDQLSFTSKMEL